MSIAALVETLLASGVDHATIVAAVHAVEDERIYARTARQERNARHYQARKDRLNSDGLKTIKTLSDGVKTLEPPSQGSSLSPAPPIPTPNPSPKKTPKGVQKRGLPEQILIDGLGERLACRIIDHRKAKKAPITERAAELLLKGFLATGDPEGAIDMMIAKNWQGFQIEWWENERNRSNRPNNRNDGSLAKLHAALSGSGSFGADGRGETPVDSGRSGAFARSAAGVGGQVFDLDPGHYAEWAG